MIFNGIRSSSRPLCPAFSSKEELMENKQKLIALATENKYGAIPKKPEHMSAAVISEDTRYAGGKIKRRDVIITIYEGARSFSFPLTSFIPNNSENIPAFIYIGYERGHADKYLPCEEICDNGFALFSFCFKDIASEDGNFRELLPSFLAINRRSSSATGKLMLWAYAAGVVMDYVETLGSIDKENIAVIGHAKLGKAALIAGAIDERFKYTVANDSGFYGIAEPTEKSEVSLLDEVNAFPYLFAPRYARLARKSQMADFNPEYLFALIPPRHLLIGSAESDLKSDYESEFLGASSISDIYGLYGISGLVCEEKIPKPPALFDRGNICYHLREGDSYLTRQDWQIYMSYIKKLMGDKNDL